ncbi:MAG: hypothetical protein Q4B77_00370 [Coriobacteriaceae bacterium]|nr:hypothetical protein [Coriobacteriaceae bacterium]
MKKVQAARWMVAAGMATVLGLTGCTGAPARTPGSQQGSAQAAPAKKTAAQKAAGLYREVLANPMKYFAHLEESRQTEGVAFEYALVEATGDDIPELLVRASGPAETWNGISDILPFTVNEDGSELIVSPVWLNDGVAGVGGFRGSVMASAYGNGLLASEVSSGTGEGTVHRYAWNEDVHPQSTVCEMQVGKESPVADLVQSEFVDIEWEAIPADEAGIDGLEDLSMLADGSWEPTAYRSEKALADIASELGLVVLSGTLHEVNDQGIVDLQGMPSPNPITDELTMHALLQLDNPVTLTAMSGDGMSSREGEAKFVLLDRDVSDLDWGAYQGKHVTVAIDPKMAFWPSDTSLPVGEPRLMRGGVAVLSVDK